ncbi:hypothetical protein OF829_16675 [Sphingomonas sp. LB-2]|uniref:hypothetical protein n=1 Tax=Sphingomonas caeni TaxID=2984949 RepID=UPI002231621E|nr:hypothetical protein [Sphingomonas caeni]MCW3848873.1 hypothetical protein [Sphingomonas caeni]
MVLKVSVAALQPPLLDYAFTAQPNPLQVNTPAWLTLAVDNNSGREVTCQQIVVTFPRGTNAGDLIAATDIVVTPAPGWTYATDGGTVTLFAPGGAADVKGSGLTFMFAVTINGQVGESTVDIQENASGGTNPLSPRMMSCPVSKFPVVFSLTPLMPVPLDDIDVLYGMPGTLNWIATGEGVTCTLAYQPADSGSPLSATVPNIPGTGGFQTEALTRTGDVPFLLTATQTVPGQDQPLVLESTLTLSVETLSLSLVVQPATVGVGGLAQVTWNAPNADHCLADDGQQLPASGTAYVILQATRLFTITAVGANGQTVQQQKTIQVSPAIVPNQAGYSVTGTPGATGTTGQNATITPNMSPAYQPQVLGYNLTMGSISAYLENDGSGAQVVTINNQTYPVEAEQYTAFAALGAGGTGGPGGTGTLTATVPPLDSSDQPQQVIQIAVTGGTGGTGGQPGSLQASAYVFGMNGGDGGPGGNAVVELTVDPSLPPAQYIIAIAGGAGGPGAPSGGMFAGSNGGPGAPGSVAFAFDGLIVPPSGELAAPRPFEQLALTVSVQPPTVAVNGLALLSWNSQGADYCILPDGSTAPASGSRYVVIAASGPVTVTAHDQFGRSLAQSATATVSPAIKPTATGATQAGGPGGPGAAGTNGAATFTWGQALAPSTLPTPGVVGGTGGDGAITLTIPPLDLTGDSGRVIPLAATGGQGGTGGTGGWVVLTNWPGGGLAMQTPQYSCPGGTGGAGGNAIVTLTVDPSHPPAQFIVTLTPGTGGNGGENGWQYGTDGDGDGTIPPATTYAAAGSAGAASLTIDGVAAVLPSPSC